MDRDEAMRLLRGRAEGIKEWNRRRGVGEVWADLRAAHLEGAVLAYADLRAAHLEGAVLRKADLRKAHLEGAVLAGADLRGADLEGADLEGADLRNAVLERAVLVGADLAGADLTGAHLEGAHLTGVNLSGAHLEGADLRNADLSGAHLEGADLRKADLSGANLTNANLRGAHLTNAHLRGANLVRGDLRGADLRRALLTRAHLEGAHLVEAHLEGAQLVEAQLGGADLTGAHLTGAVLFRAQLRDADLTGAHLTGADLTEADLTGAHLTGAHLEKADLAGADLTGAHLEKADLARAYLSRAHLNEVNLSEAHLTGADLRMADLRDADLTGADLTGASLVLARLIRCKLDDTVFEDADVTDCHVHETIGRAKPPNRLRVGDRPPLMGEDARNFLHPPATVEVYLTEVLGQEELVHYEGHLVELHLKGLGSNVLFLGPRSEAGGTILRFQASSYIDIYELLPELLAPFPRAGAISWLKTLENVPADERVEAIRVLVKKESKRQSLQFAERMANIFRGCRHADVRELRVGGRIHRLTIEIVTDRQLAEVLTRVNAIEVAPAQKSIEIAITKVLGDYHMGDKAEVHVGGDAIGSVISVNARDINAFISGVNQADGLDADLRRVLIKARQALEGGPLTGTDKDDAADDLGKLAEEVTKPEPQPGRIKRLFDSVKQLAPDVASVLSSAAKIGELIKG